MIELTREHTRLIRSVICKSSNSPLPSDIIDDLASETVVQLLEEDGSRSLNQYDPKRGMSLNTFIGMVAKSVTLDHFRRRFRYMQRHQSMTPVDGEGHASQDLEAELAVHGHGEDALSMLIRREQRERLQEAVKSLNKSDQEFLETMLTGDENTVKKLAKQRGVEEVAIRVRKSRIADRLKKAIRTDG